MEVVWVVREMGRKLDNKLHSESDDQWFLLRLAACHKWGPPGMGPMLFNILINELGGIESTITKFDDGTKLGSEVDTSKGRSVSETPRQVGRGGKQLYEV